MRYLLIALLAVWLMPFSNLSAKDPYLKPNNSFISLSGTIVSVTDKSFELDYGEGLVTVEMDGWDWYIDTYGLLSGDEVTVHGFVDDDLYESTSIEASTVYVKGLNTYYYASGTDEEDYSAPLVSTIYVDSDLQVTGKVTSVNGRRFAIDTGSRSLQVDTSFMTYNPLDNKGFQQIKKGDRVQVSGKLDLDLFQRREIIADFITTLVNDPRSKKEKVK